MQNHFSCVCMPMENHTHKKADVHVTNDNIIQK